MSVGRGRAWQWVRRGLQLGVVLFIVYSAANGPWRNYNLAHNNRRIVGLMHGDVAGQLYGLNEDLLNAVGDGRDHEASLGLLGFPWSARFFGIEGADPVLVMSHTLRNGSLSMGLLTALLVPLILSLVLGKVFCSHLCPMRFIFEFGERVRAGLTRLGAKLPAWRSPQRLGGWVLLGGLIGGNVVGASVWLLLLPYVSFSAGVALLIAAGAASGLLFVVLFWFLVDVLVAPGLFCGDLCPTGFVLEQLGRFAPFALRKTGEQPCPTSCVGCERACPYGLSARDETHRPACDACGRCVPACPQGRLVRRLPVIGAVLFAVTLAPSLAHAHHNKGLPHYGYYENYPQVPTEEYLRIDGRWEIGATFFNFQGYERRDADTPNDVKIFLYLYDLHADEGYTGAIAAEIRDGDTVVARFDRLEVDEEAIYSTRETLPHSGDYDLVVQVDGEEVRLPFHIDIDDGANWWLVLGIGAPVLLLFGIAYMGRRKKKRRRKKRRTRARPKAEGIPDAEAAPDEQRAAARVSTTALALFASSAALLSHSLARAQDAPAGELCATDGASGAPILTEAGPLTIMTGMPLWVLPVAFGLVIVLSFVATERFAPRFAPSGRVNLTKRKRAYDVLLRSRWLQPAAQMFNLLLLGLLVYAGLAGSRVANITPTAVWTLWWAGLIFAVLFTGASWCFACPWDGLANLMTRLDLRRRVEPLGFSLRYPEALRNVYPAIALFAGLTWLELGWGVTTDPRATAYMGLGMGALAVTMALLFDGKRFCAHLCPVGRICGAYATFAPVEIRARNAKVCARCETEDCLNGNERGYACPTGLSLKVLQDPTACTMCGECAKSCDKRNVAFHLRPFGADLAPSHGMRRDVAWLCIILLTLTLFHGLSMTTTWDSFSPGSMSVMKWLGVTLGLPKLAAFTIGMIVACAIPVAFYWAACALGARWAGPDTSAERLFRLYAPSLLPVALFYHLAHNLMHLGMEGGHIVPLLSDPLGRGQDLLGTAGVTATPLMSDASIWGTQIALILLGHIMGVVVAHRAAHAHFEERAATRSLVPMLVMMVVISTAGISLMNLDMNMRLGRM